MSDNDARTTSNRKARTTNSDAGQAEAQQIADQIEARGLLGREVDPTPNVHYTLQGVTRGAPTPETDVNAAREAREATGLGLSGLEAAERTRQQRTEDAR